MITKLIIKLAFAIANMSKKTSIVYLSILSFVFLVSVFLITTGLIFIVPGEDIPSYAIPFLVCGCVCLFISVIGVAITTIASNYVRKNLDKDPKNNQ